MHHRTFLAGSLTFALLLSGCDAEESGSAEGGSTPGGGSAGQGGSSGTAGENSGGKSTGGSAGAGGSGGQGTGGNAGSGGTGGTGGSGGAGGSGGPSGGSGGQGTGGSAGSGGGGAGGNGGGGAGGSGGSGGSGGGAGGSGGGTGGSGGSGGGVAGSGGGGTGGSGGGACSSLADAVRVTKHTVSGSSSGRAITAQRGAGSVVAWAGGNQKVKVLPLGADDGAAGGELTVDGTQVFGAAATADDIALLVSRAPDYMTFTRIDSAGAKLASADLVGGGDHKVQGVEWFGEFAKTGRMVAREDGTYAAYHALHRLWPDDIGHQGDTLRLLTKDGTPINGGWGWGCSHSMDQRLAVGPSGLVPVCISDCYPEKGIFFNHKKAKITDDPGANCAGKFTTLLGGLVAVQGGFFLVYQDAQGGAKLGRFDGNGKALSTRDLTTPGSSRLAAYGDGLLLGSPKGKGTLIERLDAEGKPTGDSAEVEVPPPDQDFEGRKDGEVAWASVSGTSLSVVRIQACP